MGFALPFGVGLVQGLAIISESSTDLGEATSCLIHHFDGFRASKTEEGLELVVHWSMEYICHPLTKSVYIVFLRADMWDAVFVRRLRY